MVQKLIVFCALFAVMSRVSVVVGTIYDGDSGDSNVGCICVEFFGKVLDSAQ